MSPPIRVYVEYVVTIGGEPVGRVFGLAGPERATAVSGRCEVVEL